MLPSPHEAENRGLAPPDLFPHRSSTKIPVHNDGVPYHNWTSNPKNHQNRYHEIIAPYFLLPCSLRWATWQNGHRNPKRGHIQCICVVVIDAGSLHWRYFEASNFKDKQTDGEQKRGPLFNKPKSTPTMVTEFLIDPLTCSVIKA
jgi:hypothetical protein